MASTAAQAAKSGSGQPVTAYSWFVLVMLCIVYTFNFLDRQLLSILTEPIKNDMKLDDAQMGRLGGIYFAAFYTLIGIPVGWLADRTNRVRILALGCFLWSLCTFACGKATGYPMLVAARMGVGVGEAGGSPPSYSIVSDYFPAHLRGTALAIFSLGVPFGQAAGIAFGAKVAELYDWRLAFIVLGIAGAVMSLVLVLLVREPKRGRMDVQLDVHMQDAPPVPLAEEKAKLFPTMRDFFGRPILLFSALSCGSAAFVAYAVLNWTTPFLQRNKGMTLAEIALYYSIFTLVFTGLGTWLAGAFVDKLSRRSKVWYALVPAIAFAVAIPFYVGFVKAPDWKTALAFLAVPAFCNIFYLAPALAVVQNSVKPNQRTVAGALLLLVLNIIGLGLGPTFIGEMSKGFNLDNLAAAGLTAEMCKAAVKPAGCAVAGAAGLEKAMLYLTPFYVLAVGFHLLGALAQRKEIKSGPPSARAVATNAMLVKFLFGFAGIAVFYFFGPKWHMSLGGYELLWGRWLFGGLFGILVALGLLDLVTPKKA